MNEKTDDLSNGELLQQLPATQSSAGCDRRELPASDVQQRCPLAQHKKKTRSCLGFTVCNPSRSRTKRKNHVTATRLSTQTTINN